MDGQMDKNSAYKDRYLKSEQRVAAILNIGNGKRKEESRGENVCISWRD